MFFNKEGFLNLDELVMKNATFRKIIDDNVVTDEEIVEQSARVLNLYRELEKEFSDKQLELIAETIVQTSVLQSISKIRELQDFQH